MNRRDQTLRKARKSKSNDDWKSYRPWETNVIKRLRKHHKLSQKSAQW